MLRRAEQDDRVAVLDELDQLALLLDDPRAGAVDDLEAALLGALHDVGPDAVGADDDRRAVVDVVERSRPSGCRGPGGRGRRPRCGRPGRGYASPCRRPTPPSPCRSPRERRSRSRCASRCGLPGPFPCTDYRTGSVSAAPSVRRPAGCPRRRVRRRRAGDGGRRAAMRSMISGRREALGGSPVRARGGARRRVGTGARRGPSRGRPGAAASGPGPDAVRAGDPERDDRGARAQGEQRQPVPCLLERAVGAARPFRGRRTGRCPRRGSAGRAGRPRRRPPPRSTGWTPPCAAVQPTIGQANSSFLPSQWIRRPSRGISQDAEHDGIEVRGVVGGEDERALGRDLVDRALDRDPAHRPAEDPAAERQRRDERRDRAVDRLRVVAHALAPLGSVSAARRASASRIALTTASTVSSKRLPSVEMIRASGAARRGATARVESSSSRRRSASRIALGLRAVRGRGRAPRSGGGHAPRPTPRGRS